MKTPRSSRLLFVLLILACAGTASASARRPAAQALLHAYQLEVQPLAAHEGVTLSVAGPGNSYFRQSFSPGDPVVFDVEREGSGDGSYAWEAVLSPVVDAELRQAGRGEEAARLRAASISRGDQVVSGSFQVVAGGIVRPPEAGEEEDVEEDRGERRASSSSTASARGGQREAAAIDVVAEDLVVIGEACIGVQCAVNESMNSTNTVKVKAVTPSILFEDTTSSQDVPSGDWKIRVNDAAANGFDRFEIRNQTKGTRPFHIEGGKNDQLYLASNGFAGFGTGAPAASIHTKIGNTPMLRLEQDGSSGFATQTWDVAGNESGFFIRDVDQEALVFRIKPGAPQDALVIESNGLVRIGGSLAVTSSRALKEELGPVDSGWLLDRLERIPVSKWSYLSDSERRPHIGPMAEDFHAAFQLGDDDKTIAVQDSVGVALAASQALARELRRRESEIRSLEERLDRQAEALEELRAALAANDG